MTALLALGLLGGAPKIRVVACDAPVQSRKRGICANRLQPADFTALAPGVSWWYNWHFRTDDAAPAGVGMEFLPMAWGDRPEVLAGLDAYLKNHRPRQVLALNEPNLKDQAFIPPKRSADFYRRVKAVADRYGVPVCGPQMSLGSAKDASIAAYDPIERKDVTYTWFVPFLKAFFAYAAGTDVAATSLHTYGNIDETRWAVDTMHKEFGRPVWVTEYAHVPDPKTAMAYLVRATDFFERTPYVPGYAWFKERADSDGAISLLAKEPGRLTALGRAYVAMPVHDADLYYRIPGRLQAERYVAMERAEIDPTTDADGLAQMVAEAVGAHLDYNLNIPSAGAYALRIRVSGPAGRVTLAKGEAELGAVAVPAGEVWRTVSLRLRLPAGPQTLRLTLGAKGQTVNWIEFGR